MAPRRVKLIHPWGSERMRAAIGLGILLLFVVTASADDLGDSLAKLSAAIKAQDYPMVEAAAGKLLGLRPGYPRYEYLLAVARAHRGDDAGALDALAKLVAMGVYVDVDK